MPIAFGGISVSDPDAGSAPVIVSLGTAGSGTLTVNTGISGGVTPAQVTNNGTANVSLTAPMSAINTTLANSDAVIYQSLPGISGSQPVHAVPTTRQHRLGWPIDRQPVVQPYGARHPFRRMAA